MGRLRLSLALALALIANVHAVTPTQPFLSGRTMGTYYTVTLTQAPQMSLQNEVSKCVSTALERVEILMSTWRRSSEISRFNFSRSVAWFNLSRPTAAVLDAALKVGRESDGAFDPTVSPLLTLWGFGARAEANRPLPDTEAIAQTRSLVGLGLLELRMQPPSLRKQHANVEIDLSALAKGYAVDVLAALIERQKLGAYLIDIGGEIRAYGERPGGGPWRVGLESPTRYGELATGERMHGVSVHDVVPLRRGALATSGTYRRYREAAGRTLPDTIDPRLGSPVSHTLLSVSVLHSSAMYADAYATALLVMGPVQAALFAERHKLAAVFVTSTQASATHSSAMRALSPDGARLSPPDDAAAMYLLELIGCAR